MNEDLRSKLRHLPQDFGVYLMKDLERHIIYVGKAKNLRKRVQSYFLRRRGLDPKTKALVAEVNDLEVMLVASEVEALLLERTLIKHHKPRFNILLRDDKEYPLIRCDLQSPWPRIEKVRRRQDDGAEYIGPFTQVAALNQTLAAIFNAFPLIRCSDYEFAHAKRPCNYYAMKQCLAPCSVKIDPSLYRQMVHNALAILKGKRKEVISSIKLQMEKAAAAYQYELAAQYRDQIAALKQLQSRQHVVFNELVEGDAIGYHLEDDLLALHVLLVRQHELVGHEHFNLRLPLPSPTEALAAFLVQYYEHRPVPARVILPFYLPETGELLKALASSESQMGEASGDTEISLIKLANKNARYQLGESLRKQHKNYEALVTLQSWLKLSRPPLWIECLDISHLQGTATVAAIVSFRGGKPDKSSYRLYNLDEGVSQGDDYGAIASVVTRRLKRGLNDKSLPDVLLIDGGKAQLQAALKARQACQLEQPAIISLAKSRLDKETKGLDPQHSDERLFIPDWLEPLALEPASPAFMLLTQLRDEAHRFAINQHRRRRKRLRQSSLLDGVHGLGPVLKKRLFAKFSSIEAMRSASATELRQVAGISQSLAERLWSYLQGQDPQTDGGFD